MALTNLSTEMQKKPNWDVFFRLAQGACILVWIDPRDGVLVLRGIVLSFFCESPSLLQRSLCVFGVAKVARLKWWKNLRQFDRRRTQQWGFTRNKFVAITLTDPPMLWLIERKSCRLSSRPKKMVCVNAGNASTQTHEVVSSCCFRSIWKL